MAEPRLAPPSSSQCSQFAPSSSQCSQLPPPSSSQCSQLPPPSLGGLIPPSHFVLRSRPLGAWLDGENGRGHDLEAELKALRGRCQALEAELRAEKGRSQALEAELRAEKGRSQALEAELRAEKGRSQALEAELRAEKGRSQALEAELRAEKGRSQTLEAELEAEKGRSQILEEELEVWRGRGLGAEGAEPNPEQVLLSRWRLKVFQLLLQERLNRSRERLQGQALPRAEAAEEEPEKPGENQRSSGDTGTAPVTATGGGDSGGRQVSPPCHPQGRDGNRTRPGTVSLARFLRHLQALGAAILGDSAGAEVTSPRSSDVTGGRRGAGHDVTGIAAAAASR